MFEERADRLKRLRLDLGLSQIMMADKMGLPLRTYEDIEAGRSKVRPIHMRAAMMAALIVAHAEDDTSLIPSEMSDIVQWLTGKQKPAS